MRSIFVLGCEHFICACETLYSHLSTCFAAPQRYLGFLVTATLAKEEVIVPVNSLCNIQEADMPGFSDHLFALSID